MATKQSLQIVAQAWCDPRTSDREMDGALAEAFADILERELAAKSRELAQAERKGMEEAIQALHKVPAWEFRRSTAIAAIRALAGQKEQAL